MVEKPARGTSPIPKVDSDRGRRCWNQARNTTGSFCSRCRLVSSIVTITRRFLDFSGSASSPLKATIAVLLLLLLCGLFLKMATTAPSEQSLRDAGIVPDVLSADTIKTPLRAVTVVYGNREIPPGDFVSAPGAAPCPTVKVDYEPQHNEIIYLFMTDPDAPSRDHPVGAEWAHWVALSRSTTFDAMTEAPLAYSGPSPPSGTGLHRYVFIAYKGHPGRLHGIPPPDQRRRWGGKSKVETIAKENGLTFLGATWVTSSSA